MEIPKPVCPHGHGDLVQIDGLFITPQVKIMGSKVGIVPAGDSYVFTLWKCQVCNLLHMIDKEF